MSSFLLQLSFEMFRWCARKSPRRFFFIVSVLSLSSYCLYFLYVVPGIVNTHYFNTQTALNNGLMGLMRLFSNSIGDFNATKFSDISDLPENFTYSPNLTCPEWFPTMRGPISVNMSEILLEDLELWFSKYNIQPGGHWKPTDCVPRWKVAILIPFRNRWEHLPILLWHLIPMLQKQHLQFAIYVIEQTGSHYFNRAMLFNVGFYEALNNLDWDCMIFHDVDHIPEDDRNYYGCGKMPRHFAVKLDKYSYTLLYPTFFGGVSGLTVEQFMKINGFANGFWGWGGEDDDLWHRVCYLGLHVSRPEGNIGKYKSIPHHHRGEVQFLGRYQLLKYSRQRQFLDGLNNLKYFPNITLRKLYTNITVDLFPGLAPILGWK